MRSKLFLIMIIIGIIIFCSVSAEAAEEIVIKKVDRTSFPQITVYFEINQTNLNNKSKLTIIENGIEINPEKTICPKERREIDTALVIDRSGSMKEGNKWPEALAAIDLYIKSKFSQDKIGLVMFNKKLSIIGLNQDTSDIQKKVCSITPDDGTAMFDGVYEGLNIISKEKTSGRKVLILFTDGKENSSRGHSLTDCIDLAKIRDITIFSIGLEAGGFASSFSIDKNFLLEMANSTGGKALFTTDPAELKQFYSNIAGELQKEWVITYNSPHDQLDGLDRNCLINLENGYLQKSFKFNPGGIIPLTTVSTHSRRENEWIFLAISIVLLLLLIIPILVERSITARNIQRSTITQHIFPLTTSRRGTVRVINITTPGQAYSAPQPSIKVIEVRNLD